MDITTLITQLGGATFGEYWYLATAVVIPIAAPIITKVVHKKGSDKAIIRWNKVRKVYRAGILNTAKTENRTK